MHRIYQSIIPERELRVQTSQMATKHAWMAQHRYFRSHESMAFGWRISSLLFRCVIGGRWKQTFLTMTTSHLVRRSHFYSIRDKGLSSHYSDQSDFDSDVERTNTLRNGSDLLPSGNSNVRMMSWIWAQK